MKIAVIPARGGSKRIPRKNIRPFLGKPIIAYPIAAARASGLFEHVIVSTDDEEIAEVARQHGAETPFLRPAEISGDRTATAPVVAHAIRWFEESGGTIDYACAIYATAPFVDAAILRHGFDIIREAGTDYAFSVTSFPAPIMRAFRIGANGRLEAYFPKDLEKHSQDFADAYHDAGQFYWGRPCAFAGTAAERLAATAPIILPRHRVQDIDTEEDWLRAEYLYRAWTEQGQP